MSCTHFYFVRFSTNFQGHKGEHRWDIIIVPKNIGGLGIDKIKTTNLALLSKWLWRYQSEVESLWRSLIEAKYKAASPNQFPCVSRHHSSKSPWHNPHGIILLNFSDISLEILNGKLPMEGALSSGSRIGITRAVSTSLFLDFLPCHPTLIYLYLKLGIRKINAGTCILAAH